MSQAHFSDLEHDTHTAGFYECPACDDASLIFSILGGNIRAIADGKCQHKLTPETARALAVELNRLADMVDGS